MSNNQLEILSWILLLLGVCALGGSWYFMDDIRRWPPWALLLLGFLLIVGGGVATGRTDASPLGTSQEVVECGSR